MLEGVQFRIKGVQIRSKDVHAGGVQIRILRENTFHNSRHLDLGSSSLQSRHFEILAAAITSF